MTLPAHDHGGRRDRLRAALADTGIDALYVTGTANVAYLSGFTGSNGQVVVAADPDHDALFTDPRYGGRAATESPDIAAVITRTPVPAVLERTDGHLGFEDDHVSHRGGEALLAAAGEAGRTAQPTRDLVETLRVVKDPAEVARIRQACDITVAAFTALLDRIRPGRTERDLATEIERAFVDMGADGVAFASIVAAGPNGAIPHHEPVDRPVAPGDLVTFDIGALVGGYHADFTRTVAVGTPDPAWVERYEVVRAAQQAAVDAARADATCRQVDEAARDVIDRAGYGDAFVHGIGHGVGLQIHEAPIVTTVPDARLAPATVITVEPGIYLPATDPPGNRPVERADDPSPGGMRPGGVRIEDTVLVSADGPAEHLTVATHDLLTLPA